MSRPAPTFSAYLGRHIKIIAMLCLFAAIFAVVFFLYELPVGAVGYAALLCAAVGLIFFLTGYAQFRRRCRVLIGLSDRIALSIDELPEPRDGIERAYTDLVAAVYRDKVAGISAADQARAELLDYYTMWAHQIKTPIAAMRVLLGDDRADLRAELFKIEQYVEMVLHYLRLDSEASDLLLRRCDLDGIARAAVRKYAPMFIHQGIALHYAPLKRTAITDEKWLGFLIEQLLSNALKYTKAGSVSISMDPAAPCTLVIEDTGIGIRPEDLPRVFEKGYTGYNGRIDRRATGIGLYLCRRIAQKLSHRLSITSVVGKGTAVRVDLASEEIRGE